MTEERQKRELPVRHSFLTDVVNSALDAQSKPTIPQIDSSTIIKITSNISNCIDNGDPEPIPLPSEDITPNFHVLPKRPPLKFKHSDPINEDFYQIRHKKHEMEEKKQKNREKERLEHDLYQQIQLVDKLKAVDKSTLASIVKSLKHQRNTPHLSVDLDQLHSTLLQEAREQLYRYEQLGLGRKRAQGHTPLRPPVNNHIVLQQQQQQQQQQQPESLDDMASPLTYETLLPLQPSNPYQPPPPSLRSRTASTKKKKVEVIPTFQKKKKKKNLVIKEKKESTTIEKRKKKVAIIPQDVPMLKENSTTTIASSSSPSPSSTSTLPSTLSTTNNNNNNNNLPETITITEKENSIMPNKRSLESSSSKKRKEDKQSREDRALNYFKSHGTNYSSLSGQRRSMRSAIIFGEKVPFLDTVEFSLPFDQFGDLMKKRNT